MIQPSIPDPLNTPEDTFLPPLQSGSLGGPLQINEQQISPPIELDTANHQPTPPLNNTPDPTVPIESTTIANAAWAGLQGSLRTLVDAVGVFGPLASAAGTLLNCLDLIETAARNQQLEDYEDLATELKELSEILRQHFSRPMSVAMSKCIARITIEVEQQVKEVTRKLSFGVGGRLIMAKEEEDVVRHYRRIQSLFRQLQTNLSASTWYVANEHLVNTRLEALGPEKKGTYDSGLSISINRRICTKGTRTEILANLTRWLDDSDMPTIYWMNGMAGTGKTTIACTFSAQMEGQKQLAATFFCTRADPGCREVTRIIPTIAYQLARYSLPFQSALVNILCEDPDIGCKGVSNQFERLLKEFLQKVKDSIPDGLVVIIDGLDECDDGKGVEILLDAFLQQTSALPLRFLITSRPEPEIYKRMTTNVQSRACAHLHDIESSLVQGDINLYLRDELAFMCLRPTQIDQLARQSGSLFIYAATLVRYIQEGDLRSDPHRRLELILEMTPEVTRKHVEIDALYTTILKSALNDLQMEVEEMEDMRAVLRTVLLAQEPITIETIAALAAIDNPNRVLSSLRPLRSVLHYQEETRKVSTLHTSFPDFMLSSKRSGSYFCDVVEHSKLMAKRCFWVMKEQLRFNICGLESSLIPDDKVVNLEERIAANISPALTYVCRFWAHHVSFVPKPDILLGMLEELLSIRLLFWMEVLNLQKELVLGVDALIRVKQWLNYEGPIAPETALLVDDACDFVMGYIASQSSQSTPHLYISWLAFYPQSSLVYKHYRKRTQGLLELKGSMMECRETAKLASYRITSSGLPNALSPDGTRIATQSKGHTIIIRNVHDGRILVGPLQGHTKPIRTILFSPNGKLLASRCDSSIRVWKIDGTNIQTFIPPKEGDHTFYLSLSSGRLQIASRDRPKGITRIWDAQQGKPISKEFKTQHGSPIIFSPDGNLIATVSNDNDIVLRNVGGGLAPVHILEGHTNPISHLEFTRDGTRLISCSNGGSIRIWNTFDGLAAGDRIVVDKVRSLAVSPDGMRIAARISRHVQVWNVNNGELIAGPFTSAGEDGSITFSPDGVRVVSVYWEGVEVWNTRIKPAQNPVPFENHLYDLNSIHASTSSCILSIARGSRDPPREPSIWFWDVTPSQVIARPSDLPLGPIYGFSPCEASHCPSPTGVMVYATSGGLCIVDTRSGSLIAGPLTELGGSSSTFSRDGTLLVAGSTVINVWDLQRAELAAGPFWGHQYSITSMALSDDHTRIVSASAGEYVRSIRAQRPGEIRVWNMRNPVLNLALPLNSPDSAKLHDPIRFFEKWKYSDDDGWLKNADSDLLFCVPHEVAQVRPSPHAQFIITRRGILHLTQQELLLGNQWARCYLTE